MATIEIIKPDVFGVFPQKTLDISLVNSSIVLDLRGGSWDYLTIQGVYDGAVTLGSLVNKIQISNTGATADAVDFSTAVTLSVAGMTTYLRVTAISFVHITFTTAGTSGMFRFIAKAAKQGLGAM